MVGLFADRSMGKYGWSVVGLPIGWFAIWVVGSVGQTIRPICSPTNHRLTGHLYIHPPTADTNQPKTVLLQAISAWISVIGDSTYPCFQSAGLVAVGLPDPCLQVTGQVWGVFHLASIGDISPPRIGGHLTDKSGNTPRGVWFVLPYQYLYSHAIYSLHCSPDPLLVISWERYLVTPLWFSQHPLDRNPG